MTAPIRILDVAPAAGTGESPVWDEELGRLWWVDIPRPAVHRTDPETGETETWGMPEPVGCLGLCRSGTLLLGLRSGIHRFDPKDGSLYRVAAPEPDRPENRLNDGKVSPEGRFLVGSMHDVPEKGPHAALWSLSPGERSCVRLADGLVISNGLAWSPDGRTLWHSDSRASVIWNWDYDPATGAISNRREIARPTDAIGRPDGGAVDAEGAYWSAGVSAGRLNRWLPDGTLDRFVELPVRSPTMPCFGGPGLRTLFVTSLQKETGPHDGRLVVLDVGVAGTPVGRFAD
ncbi:SMP-30/gluconolactonase/LRE family protein [Roseomonas nepalensis]|uniref:SMP-30/gluconolactonase/LRE family protein n=1 Tax=Muricoccus nepalensis TaxID=1854500 RepID=A0A502GI02_9PROT|nr:SMP-30/gluconolactonase/LRE family protein [Roseomonas nepalensis]TPG60363.1 SMP-30/gluconolactonase/LRE family protein [Roseomonas nepalensis]